MSLSNSPSFKCQWLLKLGIKAFLHKLAFFSSFWGLYVHLHFLSASNRFKISVSLPYGKSMVVYAIRASCDDFCLSNSCMSCSVHPSHLLASYNAIVCVGFAKFSDRSPIALLMLILASIDQECLISSFWFLLAPRVLCSAYDTQMSTNIVIHTNHWPETLFKIFGTQHNIIQNSCTTERLESTFLVKISLTWINSFCLCSWSDSRAMTSRRRVMSWKSGYAPSVPHRR